MKLPLSLSRIFYEKNELNELNGPNLMVSDMFIKEFTNPITSRCITGKTTNGLMIMNGRIKFFIIAQIVLFTIVGTGIMITPASASVTQWFPEEGTTLEYEYRFARMKTTGELVETNKFDVFNSSTNLKICPTYLNINGTALGWTEIKKNCTVNVKHEYVADTPTTWRRIRSYILDGNQVVSFAGWMGKEANLYIVNSSIYLFHDGNVTVDKFGYYSSGRLVDYINCTAKLGEIAFNNYAVISKDTSRDEIVVLANYTSLNDFELTRYITSISGKVTGNTRSYYSSTFSSLGLHSVHLYFNTIDQPSGFPLSTDQLIMIGIGAVVGLVIGLGIGIAAGKRKR